MSNADKLIIVQGATGQQGGATVHHLLAKGFRVRALTRDASKPAALALADLGAEVFVADNEDRSAVDAALNGAYGVFAAQNFWLPGVGAEGEIRQGKLIADAAKAAGVQHFVYTSVGGAERNTNIPHFESKWEIEQYARVLGLPLTVLRPVAFMENLLWARAAISNGRYSSFGLRPEKTNQFIAVDDIGGIAALAFERPDEFIGTALEIAGDELTETQTAATLSRVIGRPVEVAPPAPEMMADPEAQKMIAWFDESGYQADIPAVRALYPPLHTLEAWLREMGWENLPVLPMEQRAWG